jgi:hypothetical protein
MLCREKPRDGGRGISGCRSDRGAPSSCPPHANVAEQRLAYRHVADVLRALAVLRPTERVHRRRGAVGCRGRSDELADLEELVLGRAADASPPFRACTARSASSSAGTPSACCSVGSTTAKPSAPRRQAPGRLRRCLLRLPRFDDEGRLGSSEVHCGRRMPGAGRTGLPLRPWASPIRFRSVPSVSTTVSHSPGQA